jgi:flavin reductase (DIM6/NTAB) family NADH-FMN oxidoreductase RutF
LAFKNQLKRILTGLSIPQEYICIDLRDFQSPLSVFLAIGNQDFLLNVTSSHLFLGYKPLIIGLSFNISDENYTSIRDQRNISFHFVSEPQTEIAKLILRRIGERVIGNQVVLFYEGEHGSHSFLKHFHQCVSRQFEKWRTHPANNVSLQGNLIEQVRIAYSIPRIISVISASDGSLTNMFPTDLHGQIGEKYYAGSLRKGGLANEQIEKCKRIVISEVGASFYRQAYALGKNHMKQLQNESIFSIHPSRSKNFNFPLPILARYYRELKWIDSFDHGIHRIHLYEIIHQQVIEENGSILAHIHQHYAQWREDKKLETNYLFR